MRFGRIILTAVVMASVLFAAGCGKKNAADLSSPESVTKTIVDDVLLGIESDMATEMIGETAAETRERLIGVMKSYYETNLGYSSAEADEMSAAFIEAVGGVISYRVTEAAYKNESTAYVDVYITTVDQKEFTTASVARFDELVAPRGYKNLSVGDRVELGKQAFLDACRDVKPASKEHGERVKLVKFASGWEIDNLQDFVARLLTAYVGSQ